MRSLLIASALCGLSSAHFQMLYPKSIGFEDADEDKSPCGGFTPNLDGDLFDWHVGGEAVALRLGHQQCNWLFRVTTDPKGESGWEQVYPIVMQSGLGTYCHPSLTVPEKYVGKKGIVSVVSSAPDGLLYQCVAANFVTGTAEPPSTCKNATIKVSFVSDSKLSALVDGSSSPNSTDKGSPSSTGDTPEPTKSDNAAPALLQSSGLAGVVSFLSMALVGGALMM